MKKIILYSIVTVAFGLTSCNDYLDRPTLNAFDESNFWLNESTIRMYAQGFYMTYFAGYGSGWSAERYFSYATWADEYIATNQWATTTAASGNGWNFTQVRRTNLMLDRVENSPSISTEEKQHWTGIARFFRALEYSDLCDAFGDMPYYDREIFMNDIDEMYKDRQPLAYCVTKIVEDFDHAAVNVRLNDGVSQVNRNVVLAYMVRQLLYFGTLLKYHNIDASVSTLALNRAKWAAEELISSDDFQIVDDYRGMFTTANTLANNKEVIFYREYADGKANHRMVSANFLDHQSGTTLRVINNYLVTDGLPVKQSPVYNYTPDKYYSDMIQNRDPRLLASFDEDIRITGLSGDIGPSTSGVASVKFLPYEATGNNLLYTNRYNVTACPLIRYGEVLISYAEIMAELGLFTQTVADVSINKLRARNIRKNNQGTVLPKLPNMVVSGTNITANNVIIDDPDRDPTVSPILWEIRRERMSELVFEGFRRGDLKRWKKYSYLKTIETSGPTDISIGAPFNYFQWGNSTSTDPDEKAAYAALNTTFRDIGRLYLFTPGDSTRLAIYPLYQPSSRRDWIEGEEIYERQYFTSVPLDQISLYKELGYKLTQNPGWIQE